MNILSNMNILKKIADSKYKTLIVVVLNVILLTVSSKFSIFLPFLIIPLTLQTLILMYMATFNSRQEIIYSFISWYSLLIIGFPVSSNPIGGIATFFSTSFGFFVGFVICTLLANILLKINEKSSILFLAVHFILFGIVLNLIGYSYLCIVTDSTMGGFIPYVVNYLPGNFVKIALIYIVYKLK